MTSGTHGGDAIYCVRVRAPRRYGNSTFTLKNRCAEFVGDCHAASVRFVLPRTVYVRTSPLVLRLSTDRHYPVFRETAVCGNDNQI